MSPPILEVLATWINHFSSCQHLSHPSLAFLVVDSQTWRSFPLFQIQWVSQEQMAPLPCKSFAFGEGSPAKPDWRKEKGYWWADDPKTGMHDQKPWPVCMTRSHLPLLSGFIHHLGFHRNQSAVLSRSRLCDAKIPAPLPLILESVKSTYSGLVIYGFLSSECFSDYI